MTNTTSNGCTDAITDKAILAKAKHRAYSPRGAEVQHYDFSEQELIAFARDILAAPPVQQPAAAPIHPDVFTHIKWLHYCLREAGHCIDGGTCHHECGPKGECWRQDGCVPLTGSRLTDDWKLPVLSPADERAALPEMARNAFAMAGANRWHLSDPPMAEAIVRAVLDASVPSATKPADERAAFEVEILTGPCANVCYTQDEIPREQREQVIVIRKADYDRFIAARAASANETVAISDAPTPLDVETVRVIRSFVDRPGETYHGFIQRRLGIGFGRALRRAIEESRSPAMAAEAVAYIAKSDLNKIQRDRTFLVSVIGVCEGRFNTALFAGPQITHADTQERLTAALRLAREELSYIEWENDPPTRITDLFSTIDALLTAQQERPTPNAARALACTKSPDRDTKDLPSEGA